MRNLGKSWKSKLAVVGSILVFLCSALAPAEGMKIIPKWTRMANCVSTTEDAPNFHACYGFSEAQSIKKLDADIQLKYQKLELVEAVNLELRTALTRLEMTLEKEQENARILQKRLEEKHNNLEKTTDMYITANRRDILGGALPWAVAILAVVAAGAFAGGYFAAK